MVQPLRWPVWGWPNHSCGLWGWFDHPQTGRPNPLYFFLFFFALWSLGMVRPPPKAKHPNFYLFIFSLALGGGSASHPSSSFCFSIFFKKFLILFFFVSFIIFNFLLILKAFYFQFFNF